MTILYAPAGTALPFKETRDGGYQVPEELVDIYLSPAHGCSRDKNPPARRDIPTIDSLTAQYNELLAHSTEVEKTLNAQITSLETNLANANRSVKFLEDQLAGTKS